MNFHFYNKFLLLLLEIFEFNDVVVTSEQFVRIIIGFIIE